MALLVPAPSAVTDLVQQVMHDHHPELAAAEVRIATYMALRDVNSKGESVDGPILKLHGVPAATIIKVTSADKRGEMQAGDGTIYDAILKIDDEYYKLRTDTERYALVDHELTHLEPKYDRDDTIKKDKYGRPMLRSIPHDYEIGGFHAIGERHGRNAPEVGHLSRLLRSNEAGGWVQTALNGFED